MWSSWFRHCATSRKVASSIPVVVSLEFFIDIILGTGVESASNRNKYQEYFLGCKGGQCVGLTALLPSCADFHKMWEPQPPTAPRACPGLYRDCFTTEYVFTYEQITTGKKSDQDTKKYYLSYTLHSLTLLYFTLLYFTLLYFTLLTYSLTHSLTHSLIHLLTYLLHGAESFLRS